MDYRHNPPPAAQVVPHCAPIPVPNSKPIDIFGQGVVWIARNLPY
jgi:hypothetical protein